MFDGKLSTKLQKLSESFTKGGVNGKSLIINGKLNL